MSIEKKRQLMETCALTMTVGDMVLEYEQAANPTQQIGILADLNGCLESRVAWLLREAGCMVEPKKLPRPARRAEEPDLAEIYAASPEAEQARAFRERRETEKKEMEEMHMEKGETERTETVMETAESDAKPEVYAEATATTQDIREGRFIEEHDMSAVALRRIRTKEATAGYWSVFLREKFRFIGELTPADVEYMEALCDMAQGLARMMEE